MTSAAGAFLHGLGDLYRHLVVGRRGFRRFVGDPGFGVRRHERRGGDTGGQSQSGSEFFHLIPPKAVIRTALIPQSGEDRGTSLFRQRCFVLCRKPENGRRPVGAARKAARTACGRLPAQPEGRRGEARSQVLPSKRGRL